MVISTIDTVDKIFKRMCFILPNTWNIHAFIYPSIHSLKNILSPYYLLSMVHSRWEFSMGEEEPLSPHWAAANIIMPISQETAGLWRLNHLVKITLLVCGGTKRGNQPPILSPAGHFYYIMLLTQWSWIFIRVSVFLSQCGWISKINFCDLSNKFRSFFLGSLSGVNFKILKLIMIIIPWISVAASFQELLGTSKCIKLSSSS